MDFKGLSDDESDHPIKKFLQRIQPATALTHANIPSLLGDWQLQLIVPDDKLEAAAATITSAMPFKRMSIPPKH
ncbi:hypothetical protein FB451DRAFT_1385377 [Mycena latifolia]|nr:hypothetical protein FB451DRAFT_1385377 [Mycena latifolia]